MRIGIIFPGQGTQHVGMGKAWYQEERIVQDCFDQASDCLGVNIAKLCFSSHADELKKTINAQLGIFVVGSALYKLLQERVGLIPALMAGHSSGEYTAVHAAGALNFTDTLYLLHRRAKLMDKVTQQHAGAMVAILGITPQEVNAICAAYDVPGSSRKVAEVAAFNGPEQTVVACSPLFVPRIERAVRAAGGRAMKIPVTGAFHSRLMQEAQAGLFSALVKVTFYDSKVPVVANVTARPIMRASAIGAELARQMCVPVRWWDSMKQFAFCDTIIQVGPGRTFAKVLQRHWPEKRVFSFNEPADLEPIQRALSVSRTDLSAELEPV